MESSLMRHDLQLAGVLRKTLQNFQFWFRTIGKNKARNRKQPTCPNLSNHIRRDIGLPAVPPLVGDPKWRILM